MSAVPLTYQRDDERQRITVTFNGPAVLDELMVIVQRQADEGLWAYSVLYEGGW
jgi:hypothetical protein